MKKKDKLFWLSILATLAALGSLLILITSTLKNAGHTSTAPLAVAIFLMTSAFCLSRYIKKERKAPPAPPSLSEEEKREDDEHQDELDELYNLDREKEFYSCIENDAPIDDYPGSEEYFEEVKENALKEGSEEYIWRTERDSYVCLRCRRNNGKTFKWSGAPSGGHPGCSPGCRCIAEPVSAKRKRA